LNKYIIKKPFGKEWSVERNGAKIDVSSFSYVISLVGGKPEDNIAIKVEGEDPKADALADVSVDVQTDQYWLLCEGPSKFWVFTPIFTSHEESPRDPSGRKILGFQQVFSVVRIDLHMDMVNKGAFCIAVGTLSCDSGNSPWAPYEDPLRRRLSGLPPLEKTPRRRDRFSMMLDI